MSEIEAASLGQLVRAARRRRGWSLTMLAARAGFSVSYLSLIENDKRKVSTLRTMRALATALGVSPVQLLPWLGSRTDPDGRACPWCGSSSTSPSRRTV